MKVGGHFLQQGADIGARAEVDLGRRQRMLHGNVQWARALLPSCFRSNPVAGIIAVRRLFRLVWIYWTLSLVVGLLLLVPALRLPLVGALILAGIFSSGFRQVAGAALVSLEAPFRLVFSRVNRKVAWQ